MARTPRKKVCFIIAPTGDPGSATRGWSNSVFTNVIRPAVEERGYQAVRADGLNDPGLITSEVIRHLMVDALVVADLSEHNPNVFYELAVRHAVGKPLVHLMKLGEPLPFDVTGVRTIPIEDSGPDGFATATREIVRQIESMERTRSLESPISASLDLLNFRRNADPEHEAIEEILALMAELRRAVVDLPIAIIEKLRRRESASEEVYWAGFDPQNESRVRHASGPVFDDRTRGNKRRKRAHKEVCFVIAPIGGLGSATRDWSNRVLTDIIRPAVEERNYQAVRADELSDPGLITSQVIEHIVGDPLVVADLTEHNPNVFYELALRHAVGKPLIHLMKVGEAFPFDVAGMRTIPIDDSDPDSFAITRQEIVKQIESMEEIRSSLQTPISASLHLLNIGRSAYPEHAALREILKQLDELRRAVETLPIAVVEKLRR